MRRTRRTPAGAQRREGNGTAKGQGCPAVSSLKHIEPGEELGRHREGMALSRQGPAMSVAVWRPGL